ncbi:MAG TPA: 5'/3'-nucleotidase SurE [Candidatus Coprenecus stercoravium]|uniref:5'-nucleotidase SurE n=1 Tax=Candidatus Coprenecus stercoravium TaxID=2840735 RepID=A0A9D2K9K3_9BACT|nr:5'/3'-nucleotidase SurE [Candidatus Coprenecus stercoravium]
MTSRREILITNDDGIDAEGIHVLAGIMSRYGNVTVVAPLHPQSGRSAALSMDTPLYLEQVSNEDGMRVFTFNGTPVDCVKAGINECYPEGTQPDIVVSGINHGANCSVASIYSGTLGACIEGAVYEIPSIGFSLCTHDAHPDFSPVLKYADTIMEQFLANPPEKGTYINVNFPAIPADQIKGIRLARKGRGRWVEEFDTHYDSQGRKYFMMAGHFENHEKEGSNGDHWLVYRHYISVVPHKVDNTDYQELERLGSTWNFETRP